MLYLSAPQEGWNGITRGLWLVVRSPRDPEALAFDLREAVASTNPEIAVGAVDTLSGLLRENLAAPRFRALLLALFAGAALILALLGVGGVMAFSVARRTRELGVRLALGARPDDVRRLVLREGLRLTAGGVALGVLAAGLMARFAATLLFEIGAGDPVAFATSVGLVTGLALVSCYVPARRASSVDPVEALSAP
jgi:putative ABC transport system permease protein